MSVEKTKLDWNLFPEHVWANLGVLMNACADGWLNKQNSYEKRDAYRFIKNTLPSIIQTAESFNQQKYDERVKDTQISFFTMLQQEEEEFLADGFLCDVTRPDYYDVNKELMNLLRHLSGKETFTMFQKSYTVKKKNVFLTLKNMWMLSFKRCTQTIF